MNKENEAGHNLVFAANECKEWPCVNDRVTWDKNDYSGTVKAVSEGKAWCKLDSGHYHTISFDRLEKPKTPEGVLRDDIAQTISDDVYHGVYDKKSLEVFANALLTKYNITPKEV